VITFETLRPGGLSLPPWPAFYPALLRDARTLLEKTRPSLVIALMAFLTVNPAPLRRASRETFHALARCLAARDAPNWVTAATALSGPYVGRALRLCFFLGAGEPPRACAVRRQRNGPRGASHLQGARCNRRQRLRRRGSDTFPV
jgi:hypothetical protein